MSEQKAELGVLASGVTKKGMTISVFASRACAGMYGVLILNPINRYRVQQWFYSKADAMSRYVYLGFHS